MWSRTSLPKMVATNQTRSLSHAVWWVQRKLWSFHLIPLCYGLPKWLSGEESACQCRRRRRHGLDPWIRKIPWRRKWQPAPVFSPRKSHGQRSLTGNSPWGHKESDMTEQLRTLYYRQCKWPPHWTGQVCKTDLCLPSKAVNDDFGVAWLWGTLVPIQTRQLLPCELEREPRDDMGSHRRLIFPAILSTEV